MNAAHRSVYVEALGEAELPWIVYLADSALLADGRMLGRLSIHVYTALPAAGGVWRSACPQARFGSTMNTALLIIDVQRALCTGNERVFGIGVVIERINSLSCRARAAAAPVVFVQHEEDEGAFRSGTEGWELADGLVTAPGDLRVRKTTPNSFHRTLLQQLLQERRVERVVICGLQTEYCVDTTLRQALSLGYRIVLASDAHSTVDGVLMAPQIIAHHNHTFRNMNSFGPVIEVKPTVDVAFDT